MMPTVAYTAHPLGAAVTLHHLLTDRFKTARLSITFVQAADAIDSPLLTLLFGILRRGSDRYPTLAAFNRRLDELYGTTLTIRNYLYGDSHVISFTAEMPEDIFLPAWERDLHIPEEVLALFSELLLHPLTDGSGLLRPAAVEAERQSLMDSLRSLRNDPRAYAGDRFRRLMCPDEPYGLSIGGTEEQIAAITPAEVTDFWRRLLSETRCEVFYVGRTPASDLLAAWQTHFAEFAPARAYLPPTRPHPLSAVPRRVEEEMPVGQGKLCMGWSLGSNFNASADPAAEAALLVGNELLGVMQGSRLFRRVREERGLCYYCDSAIDLTKGILWVSCGIRSDRRDETEAAICAEVDALAAGRMETAEVETAKLSLLNSYRQLPDSPGAMESHCLRALLSGTPIDIEPLMNAIRAVTPADVAGMMRRLSSDTVYFLKGTALQEDEEVEHDDD